MKIVLLGGSGQVGTVLARHFHRPGNDVVVVARSQRAKTPWRSVIWDGRTLGEWTREIEGADAVINLVGKTINCRYTETNRREIVETRVQSTELAGHAIQQAKVKPRVWLNASAAGIYRHSEDAFAESSQDFGESDLSVPETWRFASGVVKTWEQALEAIDVPGVRKIALRTTMVMSPDEGGVFDVLLGLVRKGLGGAQGSGRQWVSWMHDHDYARAVDVMISDESISGPVNLASPQPQRNAEFMRVLREAAGMKLGLPAPEIAIKIGAVLLRTEPWLVLKSVRVTPQVLQSADFDFIYPEWGAAARNLVRRWKLKSD